MNETSKEVLLRGYKEVKRKLITMSYGCDNLNIEGIESKTKEITEDFLDSIIDYLDPNVPNTEYVNEWETRKEEKLNSKKRVWVKFPNELKWIETSWFCALHNGINPKDAIVKCFNNPNTKSEILQIVKK